MSFHMSRTAGLVGIDLDIGRMIPIRWICPFVASCSGMGCVVLRLLIFSSLLENKRRVTRLLVPV